MFEPIERRGSTEALKRLWALLISILCHVVGVFVFVIIPLLFFNIIPERELLTFLIEPPPPPAPIPGPIPPESMTHRSAAGPQVREYEIAPIAIPRGVAPPIDEPPVMSPSAFQTVAGLGIQSGPVGTGSGIRTGELAALSAPQPALPPPPAPEAREPIPVGGRVQESKLIKRIDPIYPYMARLARVSGTVILQVVVDEEGNVSEVKILQGHPLLNEEAVRAVRQWKYSPTLLNGEPIPVTASVTVNFSLTQR